MTIKKLDLEAIRSAVERYSCIDANHWQTDDVLSVVRPDTFRALIAELEQLRAVSGGRSSLNAFHAVNTARQHEAFAPAHSLMELSACVQEEVGELAGCLLGITGAKKRKAHKTKADALDGVADAITYLSLIAAQLGCDDLEKLLGDTFNMVSERAGSKLTTGLGQLDEHHAAGQVPVAAVVQESYWNIHTKSTGDAYHWTLHSGPFYIESEVDTEVSRLRSLRKGWEFERRMVRPAPVAAPPAQPTAVDTGKLCECGHHEHAHELNHTSQRGPCEASAAANSYSLCRCLRFTEAMVCAESGDEP